jgi:predicted phosphodiesterase
MIGVVSNSAGRADSLATVVDIFHASGVQTVVHCGDVGGRHVLDVLKGFDALFVWGDRDNDRMGLMRYGRNLGLSCLGMLGDFDFDEKRICVTHGDDVKLMRQLCEEQQYDYILCGHGLSPEDRIVGRTRILNPGPLYGGAAKSALLLDPLSGNLKLLAL